MKDVHRNGKVTLTTVAVLAVLVVLLVMLVVSGITAVRVQAQKTACMTNLRQLGIAAHNYEGTFGHFPKASQAQPGNATLGYSWLVMILPQIELGHMYGDGPGTRPADNTAARKAAVPLFRCPAYGRADWASPHTDPPLDWITNYKAMGATSKASLAFWPGSGQAGEPPYNAVHPDGVMFPNKRIKISDIVDGTANTIMVAETIEQQSAIWYRGDTAALVGLPDSVTYAEVDDKPPYYAPTGFTPGMYGSKSTIANNVTYLGWNYLGGGQNAGDYVDGNYRFGPSSNHAGAVIHLFADGQARALARDTDQALYMFLITRAGNDPFSGNSVWTR